MVIDHPVPSQQSQQEYRTIATCIGAIVALMLLPLVGHGQTAISAWTLGNSDATDTTAYSPTITFQSKTYNVTSFTAGTAKSIGSTATDTYIRRNTDSNANGTPNQSGIDNNNYSSVWYATTGTGAQTTMQGTNQASMAAVLSSNNTLLGADNVFSNSSTAATVAAGNIERVDFYWSGGFTAISSDGFAVFDRGAAGGHDTFKIAVFTGWDTVNNKPTTYSGTVVKPVAANYGASNLDYDPVTAGTQGNLANYNLFRYANGDNLTTLAQKDTGSATQGIGGVFISFQDLGIPQGTTVYGYSVMAADVVTTNLANLADWTNTAVYLTNTADANGGIDLMGFNGRRFVPEPSTYGAMLMGVTAGVLGWRRYRRGISARAA
jgi:hypothetical protein